MKSGPNSRPMGPAAVLATTILLTASLSGCSGSSGSNATSSIGTIATVAGNGKIGYSGNSGLAIAAQLNQPSCAVADNIGNLYIGDVVTNTIRKVAAGTGIISLYAGNGVPAYNGDGGPAVSASMDGPAACALDSTGNLYVAEAGNNIVRKIAASTGIITTVAGNGLGGGCAGGGFGGDGGPATKAELLCPYGVAIDASGASLTLQIAMQAVRPAGQIIKVGWGPQPMQ